MKLFKYLLIFLFLSTLSIAQSQKYFADAGVSYLMPVGGLKDRFNPALSYSASFGGFSSESWSWAGKIEYLNFDKINPDNQILTREFVIDNNRQNFTYPIKNLQMTLKSYGASVVGAYTVAGNDFFNARFNFGFGISKWEFARSAYSDSLYAPDSTGTQRLQENLIVPSLDQADWSGAVMAGLEFNVKVYDPVWITLAANYKAIIGELWATLKLDMENVSMMQMGEIRLSVKALW